MDDYIRKAVELADGWQTTRLGNQRIKVFVPHGEGGEHPLIDIGYIDTQWVKDALAAQLVRQVDALDSKFIFMNGLGEVSIHSKKFDLGTKPFCANRDDRTMNTIKAIIDSGVLNGD